VDVLQQPDRHQAGEHRRAAVGHEREGYAGHRHDPEAHADVLEGLEAEPAGDPAGGAVAAAFVAIKVGVLEDYQLDRFLAFMDPTLDPRGAGYNTTQARIAIGNGGVFGQGLFQGSQTQSGFVPEQHTDFIFTVAGEELGLVGSAVLIALLGVVLWRALRIAMGADDLFGRLAAGGIACWFGFQAFQNIGMCLGIMPVTGVPLPLVSYGGSSMFSTLMAIGLLQNIHLRADRSVGVVRSRRLRSRF
jgi:rod shape determining protein RodA